MPGRRPKPTALKELEGSRIRRRGDEPQPGGIPKCPQHLDADAKKEWRRISRELLSLGLLTSIDRAALAAYCAAWSRWITAEVNVQKFGAVIKSPKSGFPIANPYVGIANTAMTNMRAFLIEFGMTPASRSRLSIEPGQKSTDPDTLFTQFMQGLGAEDITPNDPNEETELRSTGD
jgi:P27 family predicted phage terminase small subunit